MSLVEFKCGDDLPLSFGYAGDVYICPRCRQFKLNQDFQESAEHLLRHGYAQKLADPKDPTGFVPGYTEEMDVWYGQLKTTRADSTPVLRGE